MKRILYLSFYFDPDLCAGSFRNSPLALELSKQFKDGEIDIITTLPNRYSTFITEAPATEHKGNLNIYRIATPKHQGGFADQINSFKAYFSGARKLVSGKKYDLVFASSSRLFTAYLGYTIAKKQQIPLYLDIRDIFVDTIQDVLNNRLIKSGLMPVLKIVEKKVFSYASHINLISEGFKPYFKKYKRPVYTAFTNGIDPEFLHLPVSKNNETIKKVITYAGNIGEGQGLHKIIPQVAKMLGDNFQFLIIGDGGAKEKLVNKINATHLNNVEVRNPVSRKELLQIYDHSDFLFIHLNDYDAFKKVLPSKIFELGAYDKPLIAGVAGYANKFIADNISNTILFPPGDAKEMVKQLKGYRYYTAFRSEFLGKFKRESINKEMTASILSYLP